MLTSNHCNEFFEILFRVLQFSGLCERFGRAGFAFILLANWLEATLDFGIAPVQRVVVELFVVVVSAGDLLMLLMLCAFSPEMQLKNEVLVLTPVSFGAAVLDVEDEFNRMCPTVP